MTAQTTNVTYIPARPAPAQTGIGKFLQMLAVRKTRKQLAEVDDHILEDIGISRAAAEFEASRPLWDVPNHWRASR